jgi:hypothetical protein
LKLPFIVKLISSSSSSFIVFTTYTSLYTKITQHHGIIIIIIKKKNHGQQPRRRRLVFVVVDATITTTAIAIAMAHILRLAAIPHFVAFSIRMLHGRTMFCRHCHFAARHGSNSLAKNKSSLVNEQQQQQHHFAVFLLSIRAIADTTNPGRDFLSILLLQGFASLLQTSHQCQRLDAASSCTKSSRNIIIIIIIFQNTTTRRV